MSSLLAESVACTAPSGDRGAVARVGHGGLGSGWPSEIHPRTAAPVAVASAGSGTDVAMPSASVISWAQRSSAGTAGQADLGGLADARLDGGREFLDGAGDPIQCGPGHIGRSVVAGQAYDRGPADRRARADCAPR